MADGRLDIAPLILRQGLAWVSVVVHRSRVVGRDRTLCHVMVHS